MECGLLVSKCYGRNVPRKWSFVGVVHCDGVKASFDDLGSRTWEVLGTLDCTRLVVVGCGDILRA